MNALKKVEVPDFGAESGHQKSGHHNERQWRQRNGHLSGVRDGKGV